MKNHSVSSTLVLVLVLLLTLVSCSAAQLENPVGERQQIDLIVEGDYIVSMDATNSIMNGGAVAVNDGLIIDIGASEDIRLRYQAAQVLGGGNRIVLPGLINGHSHAAMTVLRGIADDLSLFEWLND